MAGVTCLMVVGWWKAALLLVKLKGFVEHELEDVNRAFKLYNERLPFITDIRYLVVAA